LATDTLILLFYWKVIPAFCTFSEVLQFAKHPHFFLFFPELFMFKADDFGFKVISSHLFDHQGPDLFVPINLISWLFFFMLIVKTSLSYLRSIESFLSRFLIGLKFRADFLPLISLHLLYVLIKYRLFC